MKIFWPNLPCHYKKNLVTSVMWGDYKYFCSANVSRASWDSQPRHKIEKGIFHPLFGKIECVEKVKVLTKMKVMKKATVEGKFHLLVEKRLRAIGGESTQRLRTCLIWWWMFNGDDCPDDDDNDNGENGEDLPKKEGEFVILVVGWWCWRSPECQ